MVCLFKGLYYIIHNMCNCIYHLHSHMKAIWIYFSTPGKMSYPFDIVEYYESYQELIKIIESDHTTKVYIVRWNSYKWKGVFSEIYQFQNNQLIQVWEQQVHLIFNRCNLHEITDCPVINSPSFYELCEDKYKTYLRFTDVSPKTEYIHNYSSLDIACDTLNIQDDELVVLKKNFWMWGDGINILPRNKIQNDLYPNWRNILIQRFINSSVGVPNIVKWMHDLRIMIVNHTIIWATIRTPQQGSFLANVAQWWTSITLDIQLLPRELLDVLESVMDHLDDYENIIYGADFMNSPQWYKLVELNACPGLLHKSWDKNCFNFYNAIAEMLVNAVKKL